MPLTQKEIQFYAAKLADIYATYDYGEQDMTNSLRQIAQDYIKYDREVRLPSEVKKDALAEAVAVQYAKYQKTMQT